MEFLKTVGGKVIAGLTTLAVIAGAISWWRMDEASKQAIVSGTGRIVAWFGVMLVVPWASFFLIGRIARTESNAAGGALVVGYTIVEAVLLAWLFDWGIRGAMAWTFFAAAILLAGVYNLFTCDWIAKKVS